MRNKTKFLPLFFVLAAVYAFLAGGVGDVAAATSSKNSIPVVIASKPSLTDTADGAVARQQAKQASAAQTAVPPVLTYFPVLPYDAIEEADPEIIPVASNVSLNGTHPGLTRAVIVIHDYNRDAARALASMTGMAGSGGRDTLILAPEFLLDTDITRLKEQLPDQGKNAARWPLGSWSQGGDSLALAPNKGVSSFTIMDLLLVYLSDKGLFPDMAQIVVVGHGEGADFVHRYAAVGRAPDVLEKQNLPVRFVVANPSTYLYFTSVRFLGGKQGMAVPDVQQCKDYDVWPYGLDGAPPYVKRIGTNTIKTRYSTRHVVYLAGANVSRTDPSPDGSCAAQLQGSDRLARQTSYDMYTGLVFGEDLGKAQNFATVPTAGYDAAAMFSSLCGAIAIFGDGNCAALSAPR